MKNQEERKQMDATQEALNKTEPGYWSVKGIPGLFCRVGKNAKSFTLQRKRGGKLVKKNLGELTMKAARDKARSEWAGMRASTPGAETFGATLESYITTKTAARKLGQRTAKQHRANARNHLAKWTGREMTEVFKDRPGVLALFTKISLESGPSTANQVAKLIGAVCNWHRRFHPELPAAPTTALELHHLEARNWAYSHEGLLEWWNGPSEELKGARSNNRIVGGVSRLKRINQVWWLTVLYTGARSGSVAAIEWIDIDFKAKRLFFRKTKNNQPYAVPMSDRLVELLQSWREECPRGKWVFPSGTKPGEHKVSGGTQFVSAPHALRHSFKTVSATLKINWASAEMLLGHKLASGPGGATASGYVTLDNPQLIESMRPDTNRISEYYAQALGFPALAQPSAESNAA